MSEREELIKRLQKHSANMAELGHEEGVRLCGDAISALTAQQEPFPRITERDSMDEIPPFDVTAQQSQEPRGYEGVRLGKDGQLNHRTINYSKQVLIDMGYTESEISSLYTAPLSGVRAGMLRAAEICKEWEGKLSQGAGYAIRTAREAITSAADQVNAEGQNHE